mmetsp:Transcript_14747/g.29586  ORF Transcript_14747/g.29586 Transcript_14747/m.29586 type:complete len:204 (-) Transcript_14747:525-1136(-)
MCSWPRTLILIRSDSSCLAKAKSYSPCAWYTLPIPIKLAATLMWSWPWTCCVAVKTCSRTKRQSENLPLSYISWDKVQAVSVILCKNIAEMTSMFKAAQTHTASQSDQSHNKPRQGTLGSQTSQAKEQDSGIKSRNKHIATASKLQAKQWSRTTASSASPTKNQGIDDNQGNNSIVHANVPPRRQLLQGLTLNASLPSGSRSR